MNRQQWETVIATVQDRSTNFESYCHGPQHWRCVSLLGIRLARAMDGARETVAMLFGLFHDAMRVNDWNDPDHGTRGAALLIQLYEAKVVVISQEDLEATVYACETHTDAGTTADPVIGVCYDADRLNLWRVGTRPLPEYLSTPTGRSMAIADATRDMHSTPLDWSHVLDALFQEHPS